MEVVAFLAMVPRTFNQNSQFANMVPISEVLMDFSNSFKFSGQEGHQNDYIASLFDSRHLIVHLYFSQEVFATNVVVLLTETDAEPHYLI